MTTTLHQKIKFVKDDKLVIVYGEQASLASHLSSFRYIDADESVVGTQFQALDIVNVIQKSVASISSLKYAQQVMKSGQAKV